MPEQLAFEQRLADGAHVDGDHRFLPTAGKAVYLACQHLFSRSIFSCDEQVCICQGDFGDERAKLRHALACSPVHAAFSGGLLVGISVVTSVCLSGGIGIAERFEQLRVVPRLDYKVEGALLDAAYREVYICVSREEDDRYGGIRFMYFREPEKPFVPIVDACAEVHIQQDEIDRIFPQGVQYLVRIGKGDYLLETCTQQQLDGGKDAFVIVYH